MGLSKKETAYLLRIKGATIQKDRVKTKQVKLPKKPRKKKRLEDRAQKNEDERIITALSVGRTIITENNENVKSGGK